MAEGWVHFHKNKLVGFLLCIGECEGCVSWRAAASLCWLELFLHCVAAMLRDTKIWLCSYEREYLRYQFTVFYSFYWLYCRQHVILCITCVTRLCFLWAVKVLFLKMDGCSLQSAFQTVVSLLIERRNVESCFLGNMVFIHCAPLKGASSPLGCLLKYFYRL